MDARLENIGNDSKKSVISTASEMSHSRVRQQGHIFEREILRVVAKMPASEETNVFQAARTEVLRWAARRAGRKIPNEAWEGASFELLSAGRTTLAVNVAVEGGEVWSIRGDDPDKNVAGRVWSTEVTLGTKVGEDILLGLRLLVNSPEINLDIEPSVPGLMLQISDKCGLVDGGISLSTYPHFIENEDDARRFVDWLGSASRNLPVVVASGDERSASPDKPLIDVDELAQRLCGMAHVVVVPARLTYWLSDEFGRSLSTFYGAVRVYNPGFDILADRYDHRLYHPQDVASNPGKIVSDIRRLIARDSLRRSRLGREIVPFATIRSAALRQEQESQRNGGASDSEQLQAADRRADALERENETLKGQVDQALALSEEEAERAETSEKQLYAAWARIERLEAALTEKGAPIDDASSEPKSWDEFAVWCEDEFASRLVLTPNARRGVRRPVYEDVKIAAASIRWLATEARGRFMNGGGSLANIPIGEGVENAPCGADEYIFDFQGRRLLANWHVKSGGNTRQPERCLRIYYTFDEETRQIVISDMPAHRSTGAS